MRALFERPKTSKSNVSYYILNIDDFEPLVQFESQSDNKTGLTNLDFSTRALYVKPKKLPLGIILLQNLPNVTKILQIYRLVRRHWETPLHPPLNLSMVITLTLQVVHIFQKQGSLLVRMVDFVPNKLPSLQFHHSLWQ